MLIERLRVLKSWPMRDDFEVTEAGCSGVVLAALGGVLLPVLVVVLKLHWPWYWKDGLGLAIALTPIFLVYFARWLFELSGVKGSTRHRLLEGLATFLTILAILPFHLLFNRTELLRELSEAWKKRRKR